MSFVHRSARPALCLSLLLLCAFSVEATDPPSTPTANAAGEPALERPALLERSQEDATALERRIAQQEQQHLQAGGERFLALWKPANSAEPKGVVIIIPGAGETADWPRVVGPLRHKLPDAGWASLSLSLPDPSSEAARGRGAETAATTEAAPAQASGEDASTEAKPIEQVAGGEADIADQAVTQSTADQAATERIFARIDAALAFAEQQSARGSILLGHGSGAYWAARYLSEKQPSQVRKLVMVAAQTPLNSKPELAQLSATLPLASADLVYQDQALARKAALERLQASKRQKGSRYTQITLKALPGNSAMEQEQLFRRVRGWLGP